MLRLYKTPKHLRPYRVYGGMYIHLKQQKYLVKLNVLNRLLVVKEIYW